MTAFQAGDIKAFDELVRRHEKPLWNFIRRSVGERSVAEDLLQELFLRVVKRAGDWRPTARVSTWLYTLARNLCIDYARRQKHRQAISLHSPRSSADELGPPMLDRMAGGDRGAQVAVEVRELGAQIEAAIASLPVEQREVFLMREVLELPFAEIAIATGASEPTVKSRMRYALERLREALGSPQAEAAPRRAAVQGEGGS